MWTLLLRMTFTGILGLYQASIDRTFFNVKIVNGFQLLTTQKNEVFR